MKIVVTGASGLLGWHAATRIYARNCAARFHGHDEPFELVMLTRSEFLNKNSLNDALSGADVVLHFAGVNRAPDDVVEKGNPDIANSLVAGCRSAGVKPHIVYANSIHADSGSIYGRSKRHAGEILAEYSQSFTDLVLPHVFGEGARPYYNNVTATFIDQVIKGETPTVSPDGIVELVHAGAVAEHAIEAGIRRHCGQLKPDAVHIKVPHLLDRINGFHSAYQRNFFPDLKDQFDLALFNTYRSALYPDGFPRILELKSDPRGLLFEAAKGGGGGQTFVSWTMPGKSRGDHFHLSKVERFLVLEGEGLIRIRRVLGGPVWEYKVNGESPAAVDMPTMHTHCIENVGSRPLLTLFWANEVFDPESPDTYWDPVHGG